MYIFKLIYSHALHAKYSEYTILQSNLDCNWKVNLEFIKWSWINEFLDINLERFWNTNVFVKTNE